jgi:hypothetical protein
VAVAERAVLAVSANGAARAAVRIVVLVADAEAVVLDARVRQRRVADAVVEALKTKQG